MNLFKEFSSRKYFIISILAFVAISFSTVNFSYANDDEGESFDPGELIMHHVTDAYEWHFFDIGHTHVTLPLPVILYSSENGLKIFSSSKFHHGESSHEGYKMEHGHIMAEDGHKFYDISITKNVAALFLAALILIILFTAVAKGYKKNKGKAPKGIQSIMEPIIIFVRDEIVKPSIGPKYEKYLPYMLTLFFFIWFSNIMGLLPGAANLSGNIAVTAVLAVITFVLTIFSGNKNYWGHIFNPPVPAMLKPILIPVEIIGVISKPISLALRLFVAITAGHIVILSLIALTFIFHSVVVGFTGALVVTFINFIEILVATIQAYVFTLFSSMYIGMAVEEHHH